MEMEIPFQPFDDETKDCARWKPMRMISGTEPNYSLIICARKNTPLSRLDALPSPASK